MTYEPGELVKLLPLELRKGRGLAVFAGVIEDDLFQSGDVVKVTATNEHIVKWQTRGGWSISCVPANILGPHLRDRPLRGMATPRGRGGWEMTEQEMRDMPLHTSVATAAGMITRVPGGWLYRVGDGLGTGEAYYVFVPDPDAHYLAIRDGLTDARLKITNL